MFDKKENELKNPPATAGEQTPPATSQAAAKGYKYLCNTNCVFQKKFYRVGDVVVLPEKREVPHFNFVE